MKGAALCESWGLAAAAVGAGVTVHEHTRVTDIRRAGSGLHLTTDFGSLRAGRVALATSAFPPLLKRLAHYVVPVYDSVLMTEPLTVEQRASIGWARPTSMTCCSCSVPSSSPMPFRRR